MKSKFKTKTKTNTTQYAHETLEKHQNNYVNKQELQIRHSEINMMDTSLAEDKKAGISITISIKFKDATAILHELKECQTGNVRFIYDFILLTSHRQ